MGDVPLETRIALLFLAVADADGTTSAEEHAEVAAHMDGVMQTLGSDLDPAKVLAFAAKHAADEALINDTVTILGEHLSPAFLAGILNDATEIARVDGLDAAEDDLLAQLVQAWQVGEEGDEGDEGEEEPDLGN